MIQRQTMKIAAKGFRSSAVNGGWGSVSGTMSWRHLVTVCPVTYRLRHSLTTQLISKKLEWNIQFISKDFLSTVLKWSVSVHLNAFWTPPNLKPLPEAPARSRFVSEQHDCRKKAAAAAAAAAAVATPSLRHLSVLLPQMRKRKGRAEEDTSHGDRKAISSQTEDHRQLWKQKRNEDNKVI